MTRRGYCEMSVGDSFMYIMLYVGVLQYLRLKVYSGTSLIRTPVGQKKVSFIERCPHFRG